MKHIALLHTVRSVYETFGDQLRAAFPGEELLLSNTLDEFLAADANRRGEFTLANTQRLLLLLQAKDLEGADLILTTCSTLTPAVEAIRPLLATPVVAIDDAMMAQAVQAGSRILVLATAGSAMGPAVRKLHTEAAKAAKEIQIVEMPCPAAFQAIQAMDRPRHDQLLRDAAHHIDHTVDVVVLAQASMAHLRQDIETICGRPVLASPQLCLEQVRQQLFGKEVNHGHHP